MNSFREMGGDDPLSDFVLFHTDVTYDLKPEQITSDPKCCNAVKEAYRKDSVLLTKLRKLSAEVALRSQATSPTERDRGAQAAPSS
jgi:hypothetical protein